MPDGDIVHVKLPRRYQKSYKQFCEGQCGDVELTRAVLRPLKRDLQDYGNAPLELIQQVAAELNQIFVYKYPTLAHVVDRIAPYAGIAPEIMRERLICLYQTYVSEWDNGSVRESLGDGLLDSARMQGVA